MKNRPLYGSRRVHGCRDGCGDRRHRPLGRRVPARAAGGTAPLVPGRRREGEEVLRKLDNPHHHRESIRGLARDARLLALVESVIGKGVSVYFSQIFFKAPEGGGPKPPHQDNFYFGPRDPEAADHGLGRLRRRDGRERLHVFRRRIAVASADCAYLACR